MNVPNQKVGEVWNTCNGGGTASASEVFQIASLDVPPPNDDVEIATLAKRLGPHPTISFTHQLRLGDVESR